jgi:hypothetical protein
VFDQITIENSTVNVAVNQTLTSLGAGQSMQFSSTVLGTANTGTAWSIRPVGQGSIDTNTGVYTAPVVPSQQTVTVTGTSVVDPTKSAMVTATLGTFVPVRMNAGGPATIDPTGVFWNADTGATGGNVYSAGTVITNTLTPYLYLTERFSNSGPLTYMFNVPNGPYSVKLKFAEIYFNSSGQRVFHVSINGTQVLNNFDIVGQAGAASRAIDLTFPVNVTTGQIVITLTPVTSSPKISAIEITPP